LLRYGSATMDGPAKGAHFTADWPRMLTTYYEGMGCDPASGKPLPEMLRALGKENLIPTFWS
jgi:aldehyde:ferredoxin oxidoreductase